MEPPEPPPVELPVVAPEELRCGAAGAGAWCGDCGAGRTLPALPLVCPAPPADAVGVRTVPAGADGVAPG
ncbi:hypothetical protein, partial [Streptomyces sp. UNOB3_S3]|uniref:hypothetical protein n=1 Tax=Streptomyces sp. UNOB3_S3 TaxID=2871682 RepID=UPI001E416A39